MKIILAYLAFINLAAFVLCGADKRKARRGAWRIPEKTLFLSAVLGGSPGLLIGMKVFRHKTQHRSFTIGVPAILACQTGIAAYLMMRLGWGA